jgi:hypothetical protein
MPDVSDSDERVLQEYLGSAAPDPQVMKSIDESYSPLDLLSRKFDMGKEGVANSRHNVDLMNRWDLDENVELQELKAGARRISSGFSQSAYEAQPWYLRAVDDAAQTLPGIGDSILQGGVTGAAGAAIGAGVGATFGGLPGALAFGGTGFNWGFNVGSVKSIWEQSAGEMYGELRLKGVKRETARALSYTFGSLNAGLEFLSLKVAGKFAGKAISNQVKSQFSEALAKSGIQEVEKHMLGRLGMKYAESVFTETTTEGAQQASTELAKVVAGIIQKGKADEYTNWSSGLTNVGNAMLQALGAAAVLGAAGGAGGIAVGKATNIGKNTIQSLVKNADVEALNALEGKTPKQILQQLHEGLDQIPNPWEKSPDEQVVYGPEGQVLIKTGIAEKGPSTQTAPGTGGQQVLTDIVKDPQALIQEGLQAIYPQEEDTFRLEDLPEGTQLRLPFRDDRPLNAIQVQFRLNQIESDTKTLTREEKRLESEILLREKTGQQSLSLIEKWRKVGEAKGTLESEREFLEQGLGTQESQKNEYGRQKTKVLTKIFDKLDKTVQDLKTSKSEAASKIQKAGEIGFKKGAYQAERSIRRIQADLRNAVREMTETRDEKGNLIATDREARQRAFQYIHSVTTPEQAEVAIRNVKEQVLQVQKRRQAAQESSARQKVFDKVQRMIQGQRVKIQGGKPVSRLPEETVIKLEQLRHFLKSRDNIVQFQSDLILKYPDTPISELPEDVLDSLELARMAEALYTGDPMSYNVAAGTIGQWVLDGKEHIKQTKERMRARKAENVSAALQSLGVDKNKPRDYAKRIKRDRHALGEFVNSWSTWNTLLDAITPDDQSHTLTSMLDETQAYRNYLAAKEITTQNMLKSIQDRMPEGINLMQKIRQDQNTVYSITYDMKGGGRRTENFTKAQIQSFVMLSNHPKAQAGLRNPTTGNGFSFPGDVQPGESTFEKFNKVLDQSDHALIEGVLKFYEDYHASISPLVKDRYGIGLTSTKGYSPVTRLGREETLNAEKGGLHLSALLPGSSKLATDNELALLPTNPIDTARQHIAEWEHFRHYDELITRMHDVLTDPDVREHVRDNYGKTIEIMDGFFKRFVLNDPLPSDPSDSIWSALRADLSRFALGGRLSSMFTQLTSGTAMWAEYNPLEIANGVKNALLHPIKTEKVMRESPILRERFKSGSTIDIQRALNNQGLFASTLSKIDPTGFVEAATTPDEDSFRFYDALNRFMFAAIIGGDAASARLFGGPVYWAERSKGASHTDALTTVERLMEQTQQGASISQTPQAITTNPMANTILAMFTQQPLQIYGRSMIAVQDFLHGPKTIPAFMKLGHKLVLQWAIPGALLGLVKSAPSWLLPQDDDEERKRSQIWDLFGSTIMGPLAGLPLFGDIMQALWFGAAKEVVGVDQSQRADFYGKNPLIELLYQRPKKAFELWSKLGKEDDIFHLPDFTKDEEAELKVRADVATVSAIGGLLGIPSQLGAGSLTALDRMKEGDLPGAALALGGWSPGAVNQRKTQEEDIFQDPFKDLNKPETPYDMIETYLNGLFHDVPDQKKAVKEAESNDAVVDEFVKGLAESERNSGSSNEP